MNLGPVWKVGLHTWAQMSFQYGASMSCPGRSLVAIPECPLATAVWPVQLQHTGLLETLPSPEPADPPTEPGGLADPAVPAFRELRVGRGGHERTQSPTWPFIPTVSLSNFSLISISFSNFCFSLRSHFQVDPGHPQKRRDFSWIPQDQQMMIFDDELAVSPRFPSR